MKNILSVINDEVLNRPVQFIKECEDYYTREIEDIVRRVADDDDIKILAVAGPSSSGKTTTAHILMDRLEKEGETTAVVSLDDFYLNEKELPILENGKKDTESVHALNLELIKKCLNDIIETGKTVLPTYDFKLRKSISDSKVLDIGKRGIVIVEGLHAINPLVTDLVPRKNIFKLYISANTPIVDENGKKLLSSRQVRFIRRTLRDEVFRNTSVNATLLMWEEVGKGEEKYLYCYKDTADVQFSTLHPYELCLYKERFCALRDKVDKNLSLYSYYIRTADVLEKFVTLNHDLVPKGSLIREFIG